MLKHYVQSLVKWAVAAPVSIVSFSLAGTASAAVISINFDSVDTSGTTGVIGSGIDAGVVPDTNWNNLEIGGLGGTDSGTFEGVSVSVTHFFDHKNGGHSFPGAGDNSLMKGGPAPGDRGDSPLSLSLGGISYAEYDIYVYLTNTFGGTRRATVTDGSTTYFIATPSNDTSVNSHFLASSESFGSITEGTYVKFSGLTGANQNFSVSALTAAQNGLSQGDEEPGVAGFQIVLVPEPSSLALFALATVGLAIHSRRHHSSTIQ